MREWINHEDGNEITNMGKWKRLEGETANALAQDIYKEEEFIGDEEMLLNQYIQKEKT